MRVSEKIDFRFFFRTRQNVNKRMNVADTDCFVEVPGYLPSEVKAELNSKAMLSVGEFANMCRLWRRAGALFISRLCLSVQAHCLSETRHFLICSMIHTAVLWGCGTTLDNESGNLW